MGMITRSSLLSLEAYHKERPEMRHKAIEERRIRTVHLGDHLTMIFENEFLMRYQIQEMLRVEKTFDDAGIQDELDAYNPLVPNGSNFKATMMLEYPNEADRKIALSKLLGVENHVFIEIEGQPRVYAIADEDLERSSEEKTSAVHFMRFELSDDMKKVLQAGAQMMVGCDHKGYPFHIETLAHETLASLVSDLS
ncbi:DUF3501 family protein [Polynucleobacter sp. IMCC30063]|uniref:DUF3501 family protein n=1 Tax=unclassified Polynucleobacter TaxID=2640945 RepID=UPI001F2D2AAC|nr:MULTISPECIES: DUF3501 family protein [unclassified Polynucleobacter]MCE7506812.1 DUF3501 family protein [Polynucleobacter sp. IMCC30063]MCE7528111.1 DUF3501 family protein [Polynucleobacter sp. IMCC 30228]MCE7529950.1 DUF3501 family protein [Polynucleobacter sp. IMCC 29146]